MRLTALISCSMLALCTSAATVKVITSTEGNEWQQKKVSLQSKPSGKVMLSVKESSHGVPFIAWGTCFNELDWDVYRNLCTEEQNSIMSKLFAPDGELHFTKGRLTMNANDYSRAWYSCSDVSGDFELRHFNIEHDKQNVINLIHSAIRQNNAMTFFMSPWSPPAWMKINQDYPVQSNRFNTADPKKDYLLFSRPDGKPLSEEEQSLLGEREGVYPRRLALQDYFIQDSRYLQCYADMFCRFIELYAAEGICINRVMYQNEAYSYTPYPGCAWTAEGTIRFNRDYLAPTLSARHPEVELYLGTFNTNRKDYIEQILSDSKLRNSIKGMGVQWECRQIIPELQKEFPGLHWVCSEAECGNGDMDWKAAEHSFFLISDNLGNGVDEYYIWNFLLADNGRSTWNWTQNALIQFNSKAEQDSQRVRYTPEYYATRHFSQFIGKDDEMIGYVGREHSDTPIVAYRLKPGKKGILKNAEYVVVAGNLTEKPTVLTIEINGKYLNFAAQPHSFNTFIV